MKSKQKRLTCSKCKKAISAYGPKLAKVTCVECFTGKRKKGLQTATGNYAKTRKGKREGLGDDVFKSSYEANTARWLRLRNETYVYEEKAFLFNKDLLQRGPFLYTPDFFIKNKAGETIQIIEVKGYFDPASRAKIRRLKKYYPTEFKLLTIVANKKDKKVVEFCRKLNLNLHPYEDVLAELNEANIEHE